VQASLTRQYKTTALGFVETIIWLIVALALFFATFVIMKIFPRPPPLRS
jgi:hypothetical protein